jgi:starch phosphorylase
VYLLDTALPQNSTWDRGITDYLYGGDARYRLCQEVVLGIGGVAMLRALGHTDVETYHMNEGHSALLALALLEERCPTQHHDAPTEDELEAVRRHCVFTTHTPVPAGHDSFPLDLVERVLGEKRTQLIEQTGCSIDNSLNMTHLALLFSHYINGVSMRHEEISRDMFPDYPINSITNGVHAVTWTSPAFQRLYDHRIPEWRRDNLYFRYAMNIPADEIMHAHSEAKRGLLAEVQRCTGIRLDPSAMTLGFARRAAGYKRPDLLFTDRERLSRIASQCGPLQLIYAGKAHPKDEGGKAAIRRVFDAAASLADTVSFVYLEEYDMRLAQLLCSGVDLWLNTPMKPLEASGTSGMKAALNGVPSFSILDGWWLEGCVEGVTGWAIGEDRRRESVAAQEVTSLYNKLEFVILPMFYSRPAAFVEVMRSAIAVNACFFNAQRTMGQYLGNAYVSGAHVTPSSP